MVDTDPGECREKLEVELFLTAAGYGGGGPAKEGTANKSTLTIVNTQIMCCI